MTQERGFPHLTLHYIYLIIDKIEYIKLVLLRIQFPQVVLVWIFVFRICIYKVKKYDHILLKLPEVTA